jgi:hypothetical protein
MTGYNPNEHKGRRIGKEKREQVAAMIRAGRYNIDIQREMNVSSPTISDIARAYGLRCVPMPKAEQARRYRESRKRVVPENTDAQKHWRGLAYAARWDQQW